MKLYHVALAGSLIAASGEAQLLNRPFVTSIDGALSASFAGPRCGDEVAFVFTGKDQGSFNRDGVATRLMNNVVATLRRSCARVSLVSAKGMVGQQVVYNAVAEASSNWLLLELGSSRDTSLLAGGTRGGSADKGNFARRRDFATFGAVLAATRGKPYLCSDAQAGTCTSVSEFGRGSDDGATVVAKSLLDGAGTQAVLTYDAVNRGGFLCSNPENARIDVVGGPATPAARRRMATDLRERLKPYGKEVCSGYALRGTQLLSANFDAAGARIGQEGLLSASSAMPRLRQGK